MWCRKHHYTYWIFQEVYHIVTSNVSYWVSHQENWIDLLNGRNTIQVQTSTLTLFFVYFVLYSNQPNYTQTLTTITYKSALLKCSANSSLCPYTCLLIKIRRKSVHVCPNIIQCRPHAKFRTQDNPFWQWQCCSDHYQSFVSNATSKGSAHTLLIPNKSYSIPTQKRRQNELKRKIKRIHDFIKDDSIL